MKVHKESGESKYFQMSEIKGLGFHYGQGRQVWLAPSCTK